MAAPRRDYAFPFRIDPGSREAAHAGYEDHVAQMIRQLLLTSPGERADLPDFGCGLRALVFAPNSEALTATVQLLVQQALVRWLSDHLTLQNVTVLPPETAPDEAEISILIEYVLLSTRSSQSVVVAVT
jgi:uncharacterized protein